MNYDQAEKYILAFANYEKTPGVPYALASYDLRRMDEVLGLLGNPHLVPKTVHITGTKGKGSTAAMIASALNVAGYRTGLYTSPHLITLRERLRVGSRLVSRSELAGITTELKPLIEKVNAEARYGRLTTFEILTAIAFVYFQRQNVDYQVLEVGLGGRLDATNVCRPEVCVITSISLDHMDALGDTVAKIAAEKSGIIKPNCVVVTSPQAFEALQVIEAASGRQGAPLVQAGRDIAWEPVSADMKGQRFIVHGRLADYKLRIPLLGAHQLENAAVAVGALEALVSRGAAITAGHIARGLARVKWPGRLQVLHDSPWLVADGAHNGYSVEKLAQALRATFNYDRITVVCGMSGDKDLGAIVEKLLTLEGTYVATRADHPRAAAPEKVAAEFARRGMRVRMAGSVAAALDSALQQAGERDLVCVTGSLFIVAEALAYAKARFGRGR